jgi:hypothetical protein
MIPKSGLEIEIDKFYDHRETFLRIVKNHSNYVIFLALFFLKTLEPVVRFDQIGSGDSI